MVRCIERGPRAAALDRWIDHALTLSRSHALTHSIDRSLVIYHAGQNRRLPSEGIKKDCFLLLISVLMNTTEGDERACRDVQVEHLCGCLIKLWKEGGGAYADEMSALLGVLINVVDEIGCEGLTTGGGEQALVDVLCAMTKAGGEEAEEEADRHQVTVDCLDERDKRQKSSAEAYAAILLGFMIVADEGDGERSSSVRAQVVRKLGGVACVKASIERTLGFYTSTGAVTQKTVERLGALVDGLE